MKALITGISGFTGRHLAAFLKRQGLSVVDLGADLKDKDGITAAVTRLKPDYIFHLASPILRSDRLIDKNLVDNLTVDLFGTIYLIEAAALLSKKPTLLITGTNAEYFASLKPLKETDPLMPLTGYGLSKLTQELVSLELGKSYNIPLILTRTFHLIGPGQKPGFVATDLARSIAQGAKQMTLGNPSVRRDFIDVRDAIRAYWLLMQKGQTGEVYNVCSGSTISIGEVATRLIKLSGQKITVKQKPSWRQNDPDIICGDHSKLTNLTGWQPQISLDKSLKDTLDYWRKQ